MKSFFRAWLVMGILTAGYIRYEVGRPMNLASYVVTIVAAPVVLSARLLTFLQKFEI